MRFCSEPQWSVSIVATVDLHSGIKYCYLFLQRGWKSLGCPAYRTRSSEPNSRHLHLGNCYYFQSEVQDRPMDFCHSLMGVGDKVFCPSLLHLLAGYIQFFPNDTPSSSLSVHTGKLTSSMQNDVLVIPLLCSRPRSVSKPNQLDRSPKRASWMELYFGWSLGPVRRG